MLSKVADFIAGIFASIFVVFILTATYNKYKPCLDISCKYYTNESAAVMVRAIDLVAKTSGWGSGTFVDSHYVLTALHVVTDKDKVDILYNYEEHAAITIYRNTKLDIAVLYVPDYSSKFVKIGDSGILKVGDEVFAITSPSLVYNTLSVGLITGLHRLNIFTTGTTALQTNLGISGGSSGGGVFNMDNELIAVVDAGYPDNVFLGYVTPSESFKEIVLKEIQKHKDSMIVKLQ